MIEKKKNDCDREEEAKPIMNDIINKSIEEEEQAKHIVEEHYEKNLTIEEEEEVSTNSIAS